MFIYFLFLSVSFYMKKLLEKILINYLFLFHVQNFRKDMNKNFYDTLVHM